MSNTKSAAQAHHEQELADKFSKMTSRQEIEAFMDETENTFERLTAWEYLQTF
jgi:hypothetical protein